MEKAVKDLKVGDVVRIAPSMAYLDCTVAKVEEGRVIAMRPYFLVEDGVLKPGTETVVFYSYQQRPVEVVR